MSNRYDDRRTLRCNLIMVYDHLTQFTERYLPDKFYLQSGTTQRIDLRWDLFREIIANLCVHPAARRQGLGEKLLRCCIEQQNQDVL